MAGVTRAFDCRLVWSGLPSVGGEPVTRNQPEALVRDCKVQNMTKCPVSL